MLCVVNGFAQTDRLNRAQQLLQSKNAELAKLAIDSVIVNPETKGDYVSWTTRAYIYFEIYIALALFLFFMQVFKKVIFSKNNLKPTMIIKINRYFKLS